MYRKVILEFLSSKHLELSKNDYFQMTICQIGASYQGTIQEMLTKSDEITIYHIKEPRIYQKTYDFSKIDETIISMILDIKEEVTFNKNDLNFTLKDPFYFNDLQELAFESLQATLFNVNGIDIIILIYYNKPNGHITIKLPEVSKLIKDLQKDKDNDIKEEIENLIKPSFKLSYALKNDKYIYVNDQLKEYLKLPNNLLKTKETSFIGRINHFIDSLGIKKVKYQDINLYYLEEKPKDEMVENPVLSLYSLDTLKLPKEFTVLFFRSDMNLTLKNDLETLDKCLHTLLIEDYHLFAYNDEAFVYIIPGIITKDNMTKIIQMLSNHYLCFVTSPNQIKPSMNIKRIIKYLYEEEPSEFSYDKYVTWFNNLNELSLKYNEIYKTKDTNYLIVNSVTGKSALSMYYLPIRTFNRDAHFNSFDSMCEKVLDRITSLENKQLMISLSSSVLKKRKTLEAIKKVLVNQNTLWVNVIYDKKITDTEFLKLISKYKCYNVMLSCDSSVFLDIVLMKTLILFDGIYLQDSEYQSIIKNEVGLPQAILSFCINDYKQIFMENFNPSKDDDLVHDSCLYVLKK